MNELSENVISFAEFEVDLARRTLSRDREVIAMPAKAFDLLAYLIENNGRVISKDEILNAVWEGRIVEEANLAVQISNLRKALGENKAAPRFLVTVPGKGYRLAVETNENVFVLESHSVSELTVEHEEEIVAEWIQLPARRSPKRLIFIACAVLLLVGILGAGYFRFWHTDAENRLSAVWLDVKKRAAPKQLTANGKLNAAAISPDGSRFAYTTEGGESVGLWVSGINSTQSVEVVPPAERIFYGLTFSPDGQQIYYVARDEKNPAGALFRVPSMGGRSERVLSGLRIPVTFSPDGKQMAFVRRNADEGRSSLIVANVDGEPNEREVAVRLRPESFMEHGAAWSLDGKRVAVGGREEASGDAYVMVIDAATGKSERLGDMSFTSVRRVEWLPDGSGLFANVIGKESWQERQVWMIEYPSGGAHRVTNDLNRYGAETVSVSRDGTKLIAVQAQSISNIFVGSADDVSTLRKITDNAVGKRDGAFNSLTWMPDGRLLFRRFFDRSEALWLMNSNGENARQLTPNGAQDRKPAVPRDGRFVVFDSFRQGGQNLWMVNADGTDLRQLTTEGGSDPSVTPDGEWIYFERGGFIMRMSPSGGAAEQITFKPSKSVEISPDGRSFACFYRPNDDRKLKLAVFPIDGGEPFLIFDSEVDLSYQKLRWTPAGDALVYSFYNPTAWKQKLSGGPPEKFMEFPGEVINAFDWSDDGKQFAVAYGREIRDVVMFSVEK